MITALIFIGILSLLVFVHEFGHFFVAKRTGMKVEEFGFGLPPRAWGKKIGETIYSLNWLPFGGFVKIVGESGEERQDPRSFSSKPFWQRFLVLFAGVSMNFLLASYLLMLGYTAGLPAAVTTEEIIEGKVGNFTDLKVQIMGVAPGSPADSAGLAIGDTIKEVKYFEGGKQLVFPISFPDRFKEIIDSKRGEEVVLTVARGEETYDMSIIPRADPPEGEGALGIQMSQTVIVLLPFYEAMWRGVTDAFKIAGLIVVVFVNIIKDLVVTGKFAGELSGPVGIAVLTARFSQLGFSYLMQFTAVLSINLAIINALPIPALDGGRALFLAIEKLRGKPVPQKIEQTAHTVGFALLILLILLITYRDIVKLIS